MNAKPGDPDFLPSANCVVHNERMVKIEHQVADIHKALIGDPQLGLRGAMVRLEDVERKVSEHNLKLIAWGGIVVGAGAVIKLFGS